MVTTVVGHPAPKQIMERVRSSIQPHPSYGTMEDGKAKDTCPTCRGTGRIPRGQEDQLVAVIPCNDKRLKPSRTKLYVFISTAVCLIISCLVLFFLFPRSVTVTPVSLLSCTVFFSAEKKTVDLQITNVFNISNGNFVPVRIVQQTIKGLIQDTIVGNTTVKNASVVNSQSQKSYNIVTNLTVKDLGLYTYCSTPFRIHTVFLVLQMTLNISYLCHTEQLTLETYEYIDCGKNSTVPRPISVENMVK